MKSITRTISGILAAAALSTAAFAASGSSRFNVPFSFDVEGKTMPAGRYEVRLDSSSAMLKSLDSKEGIFLTPSTNPREAKGLRMKLYFSEYNGKHFLRKIYEGPSTGMVREFPVSKGEKAEEAAARQMQTTTVDAGR